MGDIVVKGVEPIAIGETGPHRIRYTGATSVSSPSVVAVWSETDTDVKATVFPTGSPTVENTNYVKLPPWAALTAFKNQVLIVEITATVDGRTAQKAGARFRVVDVKDEAP